MQKRSSRLLVVMLGALTLLSFATKYNILNLIEPAPSLGSTIGETALDIIETIKGEKDSARELSKRDKWSNILTVISFMLFALTFLIGATQYNHPGAKAYVIIGAILAIIGLFTFFSFLGIGLVGAIVVIVLAVGIAAGLEGFDLGF